MRSLFVAHLIFVLDDQEIDPGNCDVDRSCKQPLMALSVLHEQGHRQVDPRDGELLHQRPRGRGPTESHEEAPSAASRGPAVALDHIQGSSKTINTKMIKRKKKFLRSSNAADSFCLKLSFIDVGGVIGFCGNFYLVV
jgi:hypothetical protein